MCFYKIYLRFNPSLLVTALYKLVELSGVNMWYICGHSCYCSYMYGDICCINNPPRLRTHQGQLKELEFVYTYSFWHTHIINKLAIQACQCSYNFQACITAMESIRHSSLLCTKCWNIFICKNLWSCIQHRHKYINASI